MSEVSTGGPGPCPECEGSGRRTIGPLSFICDGCGGGGEINAEEHACREDGHEYDPTVDGPVRPVAQHPAAAGFACPVCLGARKVVNLGGVGEPTGRLVEAPCPKCAA